MSTNYYQYLTPYQLRYFDETIHATAWQQTKFLNWFMGAPYTEINPRNLQINGPLVQTVGEGLEEIVLTQWEKMAPGQISGTLQDAPTQYINLNQRSEPFMYLATKIAIPVNTVDAWTNNKFIKGGNMLQQAISQAMLPLTNQVDQFIIYGDDFKTPLVNDRLSGLGKFTGLFNGFQSFSAGDGDDDKMGSAGDLISTYVNGRTNLQNKGLDAGPYWLLSDTETYAAMEKGNHQYTTNVPWTEARWVINEYGKIGKELAGWIHSINAFPGSDTDQNRICITQPFISQQGRKIEPAYKLYISYNWKVWPLWGGGLNGNNLSYEFVVAWSGRLQEINPYALYHSGASTADLNLTGT